MRSFYIQDPVLLFHNNSTALDPCHGLSVYGPFGIKTFKSIKIAIIGSDESLTELVNLLQRMNSKILHNNSLKWPFPGLGSDSLKFDIQIIDKQKLDKSDLAVFDVKEKFDRLKRIKHAISIIEAKMDIILDKEPKPDVIVISIPIEILKSCRDKRYNKTNRIYLIKRQFDLGFEDYKHGYNFHHILKVIGMEKNIPTQLIYPHTLNPNPIEKGAQDLAMIAWNLAVALLYKANEIPWKYFEFPDNTCFVGISFHREFDENDNLIMRSSIAQTFLSNGKDIVLKGDQFNWDTNISKNPHMSAFYAQKLIEKILAKYREHWKRFPDRVVIHKSSEYWLEESKGLERGLKEIQSVDLVSITDTNIRFFRKGQEPVVRGTLLEFLGKYYLYNIGYIPCLNLYPGSRIPRPVEIKFFRNDTEKYEICKEILALSRLNWNNIDYSTKNPVTITFSRNVGRILSEYRAKFLTNYPDKYRYFM